MQSVLHQFQVQKSLFDQDRTNAAKEKLRQLRQRQMDKQEAEALALQIREQAARQVEMVRPNNADSRDSSLSRLRQDSVSQGKARIRGNTSAARMKNSKQSKREREIDSSYVQSGKNLLQQNSQKKIKLLMSPQSQQKNHKSRAASTNNTKPSSKGNKTAQGIREPIQNIQSGPQQSELLNSSHKQQFQKRIKITSKEGLKRNPRQSYESDAYTDIDQQSPELRAKKRPKKLQELTKALGMSHEATASQTGAMANMRNERAAIRRQSGVSMESYTQFDETHSTSPRHKPQAIGYSSFCRGSLVGDNIEEIISGQRLIKAGHQPKIMSFQKQNSIFKISPEMLQENTELRKFDINSDDEEDHCYSRTQSTVNQKHGMGEEAKRDQEFFILQKILANKSNNLQSPLKHQVVINEDQLRSEFENSSMLLNPIAGDSLRNSQMRLQAPSQQNVSAITRMANQNNSTVFQSPGVSMCGDYSNIQISFTEKKTNKGSLLMNETPPISAYGGSQKGATLFGREELSSEDFQVGGMTNLRNGTKKSVFDQKSQVKNQIKIFKRLQKHQQEQNQQQENGRKKVQSVLTKNPKVAPRPKLKGNSPYGNLQQYEEAVKNQSMQEGTSIPIGMTINGQTVIPVQKPINMASQEAASALKDIQVNFLKSPELRSNLTTVAMNTVNPLDQSSLQRALEEELFVELPKMSNFVVSPKQEKPFTALPVIVSQKTRNSNEIQQTNEKPVQREIPRALANCPNINGKIIIKTELHDPFNAHRPSNTQTTLDAWKTALGDDNLKPSMSSLTINSEVQQELEAFQSQYYQRLSNGDYVIYDSNCKMMTFKHKSKTSIEMMAYQNLDFQEFKKQMDAQKFNPIIGCNDVRQKDSNGKPIYKQAENNEILDLDGTKVRYDSKLTPKDKERVQEIKQQYTKLKKIQEFEKVIHVPNKFQEGPHVLFYARFECGNLHRVVNRQQKVQQTFSGLEIPEEELQDLGFEFEYDLYLQYDTNSEGLMHWFYFRMLTKGLLKGTRVKLNIRNLHRTRSLFEAGMLPRIYYEEQANLEAGKKGWHVDPKVTYGLQFFQTDQQDHFDPECQNANKRYHTLSLIYEVQDINESIYIAYDRPYTYSQNLKNLMDSIRNNPKHNDYLQCATLCKSLGGNDIQLLTITENIKFSFNYYDQLKILKRDFRDRYTIKNEMERLPDKQAKINQKIKRATEDPEEFESYEQNFGIESRYHQHLLFNHNKKAIIITARVHPGETQSSFALEGMVNFLLSDHPKAKDIRKTMIVYVVPMLNPDGVIQGNHRTDLNGMDMNRRWQQPSPWIHPTIYAVKHLSYLIKEERNIDVFCDIHGHFQAHGGFMYCCSYDKDKGLGVPKPDYEKDSMLRVIPQLLSEQNEFFSFKYSTFNMEAYKAGSARQAMFHDFKIINSFTLENSFFARYTEQELEKINRIMQKNIEQSTEQRKQSVNMMQGLKAIKGHLPDCEMDSDPEEDDRVSVCSTVQRQLESMKNYQEPRDNPCYVYESVQGCHHFSSADHEKLGADLCEVINKVFVKSDNYTKNQDEVKALISQYMRRFQKGDKANLALNSMSPTKKVLERPNISFKADVVKPGSQVASSYKQINDNSDVYRKPGEAALYAGQNMKSQCSANRLGQSKPQRGVLHSSPNKKTR